MTAQLGLAYDTAFVFSEHLDRVVRTMRRVVDDEVPFKDVVFDTETPQSTLSQALDRKNGHAPPNTGVLVYLLMREKSRRLIRDLAAIPDLEVGPRTMTAEQKIGVVAQFFADNPDFRRLFEEKTGCRL